MSEEVFFEISADVRKIQNFQNKRAKNLAEIRKYNSSREKNIIEETYTKS